MRIEPPSIYFHEKMAIHVRDEIALEYVEDSSDWKVRDYSRAKRMSSRTFMATARRAPSVGWPRS